MLLVQESHSKALRVGYAPPEYRTKPWPKEALIEGWFPRLCGEQVGLQFWLSIDQRRRALSDDRWSARGFAPHAESLLSRENAFRNNAPGALTLGASAGSQDCRRKEQVRLDPHFHRRKHQRGIGDRDEIAAGPRTYFQGLA